MSFLVGIAGLSGSGKSTGIKFLTARTKTEPTYLGAFVLDEVRRRGLPDTPANESVVRFDLRKQHPAAIAMLAGEKVHNDLQQGVPVFVDAIFNMAEFQFFKSSCKSFQCYLLGVQASFQIRAARLCRRLDRPFTEEELRDRDRKELNILGTGDVLAAATMTVINEGELEVFERQLSEFLQRILDDCGK